MQRAEGGSPECVMAGFGVSSFGREGESRIVMMLTAAIPQPERAQTSDRRRITGKITKGFAAVSTDRHRAFVPALRTVSRKLIRNPYREVGGKKVFRQRVFHGVLPLPEPYAGCGSQGAWDGNSPRLPDFS
ncbi:hypothetical protein QUF80_13040 [Desulfococcaceae bacterium HSG8]|nr:hypothetical protein [Desulfococcaceae bacterium HSG8]